MGETPRQVLRVFLADDHPVLLEGMKMLVRADPGLDLVGDASDGATALVRAIPLQPDVVVLDLSMPGMHGSEVARSLLAASPQSRILILTVHEDGAYLRQLLRFGVAGYVLKRSATDELRRGIYAVGAGGIYIDPAIAGRAIGLESAPAAAGVVEPSLAESLSHREVDVLRLTAMGYSNKEIATKMEIGVKTVDTYKARAMAKLGFQSRVEVVRFALAQSWLTDREIT
jgi:DNA-binding NarL/FixJ family response regulator